MNWGNAVSDIIHLIILSFQNSNDRKNAAMAFKLVNKHYNTSIHKLHFDVEDVISVKSLYFVKRVTLSHDWKSNIVKEHTSKQTIFLPPPPTSSAFKSRDFVELLNSPEIWEEEFEEVMRMIIKRKFVKRGVEELRISHYAMIITSFQEFIFCG